MKAQFLSGGWVVVGGPGDLGEEAHELCSAGLPISSHVCPAVAHPLLPRLQDVLNLFLCFCLKIG